MPPSDENKARYAHFIHSVVNAKDYSVVDDVIAADVISHDPFPGQSPGAAGVKETFQKFHAAFPDLHVEIEDMIAEQDKVVCRIVATGTHKGEFMGQQPTGNPIRYDEILILRFEGGKVVEHWAVADALALMESIGARPH